MPAIHKSNKNRQGIFISYARSDGKNFTDDLRRHLIEEYRFQIWQDIVELEGGKDWWLQIKAAIKSVEFLVMVMIYPFSLCIKTTSIKEPRCPKATTKPNGGPTIRIRWRR